MTDRSKRHLEHQRTPARAAGTPETIENHQTRMLTTEGKAATAQQVCQATAGTSGNSRYANNSRNASKSRDARKVGKQL
jgi:hypothetical protein